MKNLYKTWILGTFILSALSSISQAQVEKFNLTVKVDNIQKASGSLMFAIYDNEKDYMKNAVYTFEVVVEHTGEQKVSTKLPYGKYAITMFHDVNSDGELDKNFMGIPKEPYGFSNNAKGNFGPPHFEDALCSFQKDQTELSISLK